MMILTQSRSLIGPGEAMPRDSASLASDPVNRAPKVDAEVELLADISLVDTSDTLSIEPSEATPARLLQTIADDFHARLTVEDASESRTRKALISSEHRLQLQFDHAPLAQVNVGLDGCIVSVNDALCRLVGRDRAELLGMRTSTLLDPTDREGRSELDAMLLSGAETASWERTIQHGDGHSLVALIHAAPVRESDGRTIGLVVSLQVRPSRPRTETSPPTRREIALGEEVMRTSEARHRAVADMSHLGFWAIELGGRTLYANNKLSTLLGLDLSDLYERNAVDVLFPEGGPVADQLLARRKWSAESFEIRYERPDGDSRLLRLTMKALPDDAGATVSLAVITDITAADAADRTHRTHAMHDDLTGLANRTMLADRLELALTRQARTGAGPVAVIFADLEEFKLINDSLGHSVGDALLVKVAERLQATILGEDTLARYGGDEFVVVCQDADEARARGVADDMLAALREPFNLGGRRVQVSVSIGIALSPPDSAPDLLRFAGAAMHDAKSLGPGRVRVFDVSLTDRAEDDLQMANELREALQRNQLTLDYQPMIDLRTGRLEGLATFPRWNHPRLGVVAPARLSAVAEAGGLTALLDRCTIERASQEVARVRAAVGAHVCVSVRIHAEQLADPDFEAFAFRMLTDHQVPRGALVLEITESAAMRDPEPVRQILERMRLRGVESAIDDFGSGFASLGNLSTLPVSALKIGHGFVARMSRDSNSLAIVASVVDLARAMHLATVAVGVETREQLTILRQLGCSSGQGSLWSDALPLEQLHRVISAMPGRRFDVALDDQGKRVRHVFAREQVTVEHGLQQITRMRADGSSFSTIAAALNADGYRTPRGLRWHHATVARVISDHEYPKLWDSDQS
jgi:diguanylate cyclase (GGDEF)-like protein/PAS domain S-box-containing protein